jgi:hypothetical protein
MKKKLVIVFSLVCFIVILGFLSDFIILKIQDMLEQRILSILPDGSYMKNISIKGVTEISADSIYIKDFGLMPKVKVLYSPAGVLRRRIKKVFLDSPSFSIPDRKRGTEGGGVSALFFVEEIQVSNGSVEWKGHNFKINGTGGIFSTGSGNIVLDIKELWGKVDDIPFNVREIDLSISDRISSLDVESLKIGKSEFEIESNIEGEIQGNGRIYLTDLKELFNIEAKGFLDVFFSYDTVFTYKGRSHVESLANFNLPEFDFAGVEDSVSIEGEKISGFFDFGEEIYGRIRLRDFNLENIRDKFPDSKLSGFIDFNYIGKDTLSFISELGGEILQSPLENLCFSLTAQRGKIYIDSCKGWFNEGEFDFSGSFEDKINGILQVNKVDITPVAEFFGIKTSAILDLGLSINERIYGAFSLENLTYQDVKLDLIEGNLNLIQERKDFSGTVDFVSRNFLFKDRKIFDLGETHLKIAGKELQIGGIFKGKRRKLNYDFALNSDTIKIKSMRFEYPDGWLYLADPFSFSYTDVLRLQNVKFLGNKGEIFKVDNIFVSSKEIKGDLEIRGFRPEFLREFGIIRHPFSGQISGDVSLRGVPDSPVFYLRGGGKIGIREEEFGDSLDFFVRYENKKFFIEKIIINEEGKKSEFKGVVDPGENYLDVEMELREAGTWIFYPLRKYVLANSSDLSGNIQVRGDFNKPLVYGEASLKEADLLVKDLGIEIKELRAEAFFKGEEGELENISAFLGEGKVEAEGRINLTKKEFHIKSKLRNSPITWDYINATIDGDLSVNIVDEKVFVEGNVFLNRATITMEFEQKKEKGGRPSNLFLDLTFDASQGNVWIRNDLANIELAGKVGVNYEGGPLLLSGNLEVRQGTFYYLYKSFEVTEGKFNFNESPEINPNINVKAITLISDGSDKNQEQDTVFLEVTGTMKVPVFDIYSKSSLSKAEIITLLSLNVGWEDLTSVKPLGQSVTEKAFNYWVRQTLNRRLKEEFGIDVLEMQGGNGHYEFVVGKYVTDKLFVKARTDIQSYGISEIEAEYKLKKWGYLKAERDFEGQTRFLFNLEWRY